MKCLITFWNERVRNVVTHEFLDNDELNVYIRSMHQMKYNLEIELLDNSEPFRS